jgi:hypothetical protein
MLRILIICDHLQFIAMVTENYVTSEFSRHCYKAFLAPNIQSIYGKVLWRWKDDLGTLMDLHLTYKASMGKCCDGEKMILGL